MAYNNVKVKERQTVTQSSQTQELGIVSEVPMNEWNATVSYEKLNLVTYKNATFIAKQANTGIAPFDADGWENVWMLLKAGVGISSTVVEYASGSASSPTPPQDGWSSELPAFQAGQLLWARLTITYTDDTQAVFYSVGVTVAPTKTSDLQNDGSDGTSPFGTEAFINSSINNLAAFYITYNAEGAAFPTKAALTGATTFYNDKKPRVPTTNDYAIVLADESQPKNVDGSYPTTRYIYQGGTYPAGSWSFQWVLNNTPFTQAQVDAINSGITKARLEEDEKRIDVTANLAAAALSAANTADEHAETAANAATAAASLATAESARAQTEEQKLSKAISDETARATKAEEANAQAASSAAARANVSVRYDTSQGLTADQQKQARDNINAVSLDDIPTIPSSLPPSGAAGGDLSGNYPNPVIADGAVTKLKCDSNVQASLTKADNAVPSSTKGIAGGVASLGTDGKVPASQLPESASGDYIPTSDKGSANGVATLNSDGVIPINQIPAALNGDYTAVLLYSEFTVTTGSKVLNEPIASNINNGRYNFILIMAQEETDDGVGTILLPSRMLNTGLFVTEDYPLYLNFSSAQSDYYLTLYFRTVANCVIKSLKNVKNFRIYGLFPNVIDKRS